MDISLGFQYLRAQKYEMALSVFKVFPGYQEQCLECYIGMKNPHQIIKWAEKHSLPYNKEQCAHFFSQRSNHAKAYEIFNDLGMNYEAAQSLMRMKDYSKALDKLEVCHHPYREYRKYDCYMALGYIDEALRSLERGLSQDKKRDLEFFKYQQISKRFTT